MSSSEPSASEEHRPGPDQKIVGKEDESEESGDGQESAAKPFSANSNVLPVTRSPVWSCRLQLVALTEARSASARQQASAPSEARCNESLSFHLEMHGNGSEELDRSGMLLEDDQEGRAGALVDLCGDACETGH